MRAAPLKLPDRDRDELEKWVRSSAMKAGLALRARIVLLIADGVAHVEIARRFSISRQTVINWRARYESGGVTGLFDEDRSGRPRTLDREQLISVTLAPPPRKYGVTHWSSRLLAAHLGIGYGTVARVWRDHGIQPWRAETFKFSTDPELVAKVTDIIGLYLDPPENAIVLCVDEKSQIQALDRTAPTLPMQIGMPERQTHDYVRNGTTTMSVLGGMSESERQHIQARVRAAMDAQVLNEGRHQGGRAPFGYMVVDGGCHPNPRKSAEGYRLRVLAIDEEAADVVRRIFADYVDGKGDRAIAEGLNRDGVPCPSARRPDQNRHRLADGWQGSTVGAILQNPKYTGYAIFGRWTKAEILMDPDNVSEGHVVRFRRASSERIVRSRRPAHPAIVSVAQFTEVQLLRRSRAAGGLDSRRKLERGAKATKWPYALKGMVRCALCGRRMEGTPRRSKNESRTYYRCAARSIAPGSAVLSSHPKNVYLAERAVIGPLNAWIGQLFDREHRNETIRRLAEAGSEASGVDDSRLRQAKKKLADAETRMRRLQLSIEAGVEPAAVADALNRALEEREAARADLDRVPTTNVLNEKKIAEIVDGLGNVAKVLNRADPSELAALYAALRLEMVYNAAAKIVGVSIRPTGRGSNRVRGGT